MIVNGGKKYLRDTIAGAAEWELDREKRYMGAGISTNTNAGVVGPTTGVSIDASGFWQGPANSDFKLSDEITVTGVVIRPECSFSIGSNGTVHVQAQFTDSNFESGATETYNLYEFGIFLHSGLIPGNSPVDFPTTENKKRAMIARTVTMYQDVTEYKTWAYVKRPGVPLNINFDLIDFGA